MKKFLSVLSLMLVAFMIVAIPVGAEEIPDVYSGTMTKPNTTIYYAKNVSDNVPNIDGTIEEGEYGNPIRVEEPRATNNENYGASWKTDEYDESLSSTYMDFYFAYDEENIYMAIYDAGPEYVDDGDEFKKDNIPFRHNYRFELGFDPKDVTSWIQWAGGSSNGNWASPSYFEFGSKKAAPIKTYDFVSECIVKEVNEETGEIVAFGDLVSASGFINYTDGPWAVTMEFKIDKESLANCLNQCYYTDYETVSDAMWISFTTNGYRAAGTFKEDGVTETLEPMDPTQYFRWLGLNDITDKQVEYEEYGLYEGSTRDYLFDLVVFADEDADIRIANPFPTRPETEPPVVETEPPVVETKPEADESTPAAGESTPLGDDTPDTEPAKGGCGSAVSFAGLALVAALGTCTAFVAKKKED